MNLTIAFFRLIRSVNLIFIVLTQALFQYGIIMPIFRKQGFEPVMDHLSFALLSFSSVCIAAAGYIINDYFDIHIDKVNKPAKIVVEKVIHRRSAIIWHWILSLIGVALGFLTGWMLGVFWLGFANLFCVAALWFYSTIFKKKLLTGNVIISFLTAWVVLVVGFITYYKIFQGTAGLGLREASQIIRFTFLYGGFAFIISLIREVIKDIEDMDGDARFGCQTMPVIWGVHVSKVFAGTWLVMLICSIIVLSVYILQFKWWIPLGYCFILIILPLFVILQKLIKAKSTTDFHHLSTWVKLVMLTGILSMGFFLYY